jgi:NAD(P)-dependent dehydrogenase (short-subunit alcohol dehydrogenase family)
MGRTVFVTGAGRGLGLALARAFAARGDRVFAGFHEPTAPLAAADAAALAGGGGGGLPLDVSDLASVRACVRSLAAAAGSLDLVVNNAAVLGPLDRGAAGELDYASMLRVFDVNALGALRVCQECWPLLASGKDKLIVNIGSEAGSVGACRRDGWFGYGMSKAALNMASAQFHNAVKPLGGRVLVLHPGWVRTWMRGELDAAAELSPAESAAALVGLIDARGGEVHDKPLYLQWDGKELPW